MNIFEYNFEYIQRYKNDNNQSSKTLYSKTITEKFQKKKQTVIIP